QLVLLVPQGVTLASDRGHDGSPGALIYSDAFATSPMIRAGGPGVRITGLRLRGPDPERRLAFHHRVFTLGLGGSDAYYRLPNSQGVMSEHGDLEVDNCEISAFSSAGVYLHGGKDHHVHHNFIHHCQ